MKTKGTHEPINRIEINLVALRRNLKRLASKVRRPTSLLVVVKAEAYGHGMVRVAGEVQKSRLAAYLGVSSIWEALRLRGAGIRMPILILGVIHPTEAGEVIRHGLTASVSSIEEASCLDRAARAAKKKAKVHAELDTGMGRLGIWCAEAILFLHKINEMKNIELEGVFTHFPSADDDDPRFSLSQIKIFDKAIDMASDLFGKPFKFVHMANSAGLLAYKPAHFNLVRPGILVYGLSPADRDLGMALDPVLSLKSKVAFIKTVEKGRTVSYARTYVASRATRIATVPLGYSAGYPFYLSNKSEVLIRGKRYKVAGRVTMDHIMVDIGMDDPIRRWDEVVLIGKSGNEQIRVEELARLAGTIPYQIVCGLSQNLPRVYAG